MNGAPETPRERSAIPQELVESQLQKILISTTFVHSERLRRFLRYCVQQAIQGKPDNLREYVIALEVFDRPQSYSPAADPIVRVEARRLRTKLQHYYEREGSEDTLIIEVPKGSYLPSFQLRKRTEVRPPNWRMIVPLAGALASVVVLVGWWLARSDAPPKFTFSRVTFDSGLTTDAAISPDGSLIAYASDRKGNTGLNIWVQLAAGGQAIQLTHGPEDNRAPSFSHDGTMLAFRSERKPAGIYVIPSLGGEARLIVRDGRDPSFSPDGRWIAYWVGSPGDDFLPPAGKLYIVPAAGGSPRQLAVAFPSAAFPVWAPDQNRLLFEGTQDSPSLPEWKFDWWTLSIDGSAVVRTGSFEVLSRAGLRLSPHGPLPFWSRDGLIFSAAGGDSTNLWRLNLPARKPQRLTLGSGVEVGPSVATNGTIAFSSLSEIIDVWSLRPGADSADPVPAMEKITDAAARSIFPSVSTAPSKLAYMSDKTPGRQFWVRDLHDGTEAALPAANARYPMISRDGAMVAFSDGNAILVAPSSGGEPKLVCSDCGRVWDWSPDNAGILYVAPGPPNAIGEFVLASGSKRILLRHPQFDLANARFSPDDRWVAFHSILGPTQRQILIASYASGKTEDWIPVTDGSGLDRDAVWSADGSLLYFLSERDGFRCIWAQKLDRAKKPAAAPFPVAHFHSARQSLSDLGDVGAIGLSFASGRLFFSLGEVRGNVWIARPDARP